MEEPVCEPAAVALYFVSKLAKQYVKVLISGEGGDEAFGGYDNYRNLFWLETVKKALGPLRGPVGHGLELIGNLSDSRVIKKYAPFVNGNLDEYYLSRISSPYQFFNETPSPIYSESMSRAMSKVRSADVARNLLSKRAGDGPLEKMLYVDTKIWLPDDLLIKADRMTMANSIELRVPFLDHKILEFAARLPRNQKVRGWGMKYLLKKALAKHVPDQILYRRKVGFPVPYEGWLRNDLKDLASDVLLDSKAISRGYFRREAVESLIARNSRTGRNSAEIFSLVVLELWHHAFTDPQGTSPSAVPGTNLMPVSLVS